MPPQFQKAAKRKLSKKKYPEGSPQEEKGESRSEETKEQASGKGDNPGFKVVQKKIASQGHSMKSAGAILAAASRNASPAAKKANPNLKKV